MKHFKKFIAILCVMLITVVLVPSALAHNNEGQAGLDQDSGQEQQRDCDQNDKKENDYSNRSREEGKTEDGSSKGQEQEEYDGNKGQEEYKDDQKQENNKDSSKNNCKLTVTNPSQGQTYKAYKVFDLTYSDDNVCYTYTKKGSNDKLFNALCESDSPFTLEKTSRGEYNVSVKKDCSGESIGKWLKAHEELLELCAEKECDSNEALSLDVSDPGYYYINTSLGTEVIVDTAKEEQKITEKNEAPSLSKEITNENSYAALFDQIGYKITIEAPKGAVNYKLTDELDDTLILDTNSSNYTVQDTNAQLTDNEDYIISFDEENNSFTIVFDDEYLVAAAPTTITIDYQATISGSPIIRGDGNKNSAQLTYGYNEDATPESIVTIYVFDYTILKQNSNGVPLANAKFSICTDSEGNNPINFNKLEGAEIYYATDNGTTEITTTDSGSFNITGVVPGIYYLFETEPPAGYNGLTSYIKITVAEDGQVYKDLGTDNPTADDTALDNATLVVINNTGSILPETGGIGTTILYGVGGLMIMVAAILLITKRRMGAQ